MATTFKGFISLPGGFINVAVKASPAARDDAGFSFNQLHSVCGSRIKMPKRCLTCDRDITNDGPGKAYGLLYQGLKASGMYAIGKITLSAREQIIIIRPLPNDVLIFHTMFYEAEVRSAPSFKLDAIAPKELSLAKELLTGSADKFTHSEYADGYVKSLRELIEAKRNGTALKAKPTKKPAGHVVDLMEALQQSIKTANKRKKAA